MNSARWAGAVDTVGGATLTNLIKSTLYGGCVSACGLVAGHQLDMTVYPFLLRGVTLCGVASADCPMPQRLRIWELLSGQWRLQSNGPFCTEIGLEQLPQYVDRISRGKAVGRIVVKIDPKT